MRREVGLDDTTGRHLRDRTWRSLIKINVKMLLSSEKWLQGDLRAVV